MLNLKLIIFGIFAGVLLASFYIIFVRTTLGRFVRAILERQAFDSEHAVTLGECGLERHVFTKWALKHGYTLRRVIRCVEEEAWQAEVCAQGESFEQVKQSAGAKRSAQIKEPKLEKSLQECHFYIPEKDRYIAEMRFRKGGNGYPTLLFVLLVSVMCIFLIFALLPQLVRFLDNVISMFSWKGNLKR